MGDVPVHGQIISSSLDNDEGGLHYVHYISIDHLRVVYGIGYLPQIVHHFTT